ncbi:probably inactive leucine-rich repeat receptor-like protein kinase IMK2 [Magnolia sinica]|uniref:probably inactive leucine-rich repeat receptor-like protein kinase IMK2 n=1 Tax=Magnolia sinica TaxID=86752 RepID=UPI00265B2BD2|nr:probably inactive leucine-rich repeat receptor-like protein kinase IMK2 [Magnolia sinica]
MEPPHLISHRFLKHPFHNSQFPIQTTSKQHPITNKKSRNWKNLSFREYPFQHFGFHFKFVDFSYIILLLQFLIFSIYPVSCQPSDGGSIIESLSDYQALLAFKHALIDRRGILNSWNDSGTTACSGGWAGIKCINGQVTTIQLPWKGLGGEISEQVGHLSALRKLSLHDNFIQGQIPSSLGLLRNLRGVVLSNNRLSGSIPPSIGNWPQLRTLDLSNNFLTGLIPAGLSNTTRLHRLNLSYNELVGPIPVGLTRSVLLTYLDLQHNNLSGSIPSSLGELSGLEEILLNHNKISGRIPDELGTLSKLRILDLSDNEIDGHFSVNLCNLSALIQLNLGNNRIENQIPEAVDRLQSLSVLVLRRNQLGGPIPSTLGKISGLSRLDIAENNLIGPIPATIADLADLGFFNVSFNNLSGLVPLLLSEKFNSSSFKGNLQLCGYAVSVPCPSSPPPTSEIQVPQKTHHRKLNTREIVLIAVGSTLALILLFCSVLLCCLIRKRTSSAGKSRSASGGAKKAGPAIGSEVESGGQVAGKLVHFDGPLVFTADDLLCATAEIMGKSGYGTVYKATLEDGNEVAVKRLREKVAKNRKEFEAQADVLGKIRHPNLVSLRAYYVGPKGEKLLVFDFMPKGSLSSFLHARGPHTHIDWPTRMNIAVGVTRGLIHLHTHENMVHGNLTSGNILLDDHADAKITDFGLSHLVTSAANSDAIATAGTLGYRAPELSKVKDATTKCDVYSLGVIILELLTGKSPGDSMNGMDLPQWVASIVNEEWTNEVFDVDLTSDASSATGEELLNMLKLALHCVDPSPAARPEVQQVLQQLEQIKPELVVGPTDDVVGAPPTSD